MNGGVNCVQPLQNQCAAGVVPANNSDHCHFSVSARNRAKHVWSIWSGVRTKLKATHAVHFRSGQAKANPSPLRQLNPSFGST